MKSRFLPAFECRTNQDNSPTYATHIDVKSIGSNRNVTIHLKAHQFEMDSLTKTGKDFSITVSEIEVVNGGAILKEAITYKIQPVLLSTIPGIEHQYRTPDNKNVFVNVTKNEKQDDGTILYGQTDIILTGFITKVEIADPTSKTGYQEIPFHKLISHFEDDFFNNNKRIRQMEKFNTKKKQETGFISLVKTN